MAFRFFRQLYSLDTLDTRFIVPATTPPKEALKEAELDPAGPLPVENEKSKGKTVQGASPSRWNTPEFYVYYVSISASIFMMFKLVLQSSKGPHAAMKVSNTFTDSLRNTPYILSVLTSTVRWLDTRAQSRKLPDLRIRIDMLTCSGQYRCSVFRL
jgi:hypothetical protein